VLASHVAQVGLDLPQSCEAKRSQSCEAPRWQVGGDLPYKERVLAVHHDRGGMAERWIRAAHALRLVPVNDPAALLAHAVEALRFAHSPYSQLKVGAAVLTASGRIHSGCNVESVAFPVGGCAEHHAIAAAVRAEGSGVRLLAVAVAARDALDRDVPIPPCGACRQLILEFGPQAQVSFHARSGRVETFAIGTLLPESFDFPAPQS
jgi:cytidine deaminase